MKYFMISFGIAQILLFFFTLRRHPMPKINFHPYFPIVNEFVKTQVTTGSFYDYLVLVLRSTANQFPHSSPLTTNLA